MRTFMDEDEQVKPFSFEFDEDSLKDEPQVCRKHTVAILLVSMFCLGVLIAIQDMSFQQATDEKGVPTRAYGLYLGSIDAPSLFLCVILGSFISEIGSKRMFILGLFIRYISCLIFGALGFISDGEFFYVVSFASQIIGGLGKALINMGALTHIFMYFQENCCLLISLCESMFQIGHVLIPATFGFQANLNLVFGPFLVLAFLLFVLLILSYIYFPSRYFLRDITVSRLDTVLSSLIHIKIWFIGFCASAVSMYLAFLAISFEHSVKSVSLSSEVIGGLFTIPYITFALITPICGYLLDREVHPLYFMLSGAILSTTGISIFGVPPNFPLKASLYTVISGLAAFGLGAGGLYVPSLIYMKIYYFVIGFPDDPTAHALVTSVFLTTVSVGGILGPAVGAILLREFGFSDSNLVFLAGYIIATLITVLLVMIKVIYREGNISRENYDLPEPVNVTGNTSRETDPPLEFHYTVTEHQIQAPENRINNEKPCNDDLFKGFDYQYDGDIDERSSRYSRSSRSSFASICSRSSDF